MIPTFIIDENNRKYIVADFHLIDYFLDFFYMYELDDIEIFRAFYCKYFAEIQYRKSHILSSALIEKYYQISSIFANPIDMMTFNKAFAASFFIFMHEFVHSKSMSSTLWNKG